MTANIRLITFDLDDTLWDVRPALEAAEQAQWSCLRSRFPNLALETTTREELATIRSTLLRQRPELAHHISLFRETFIEQLLRSQGVPPDESVEAARQAFEAFLSERHRVTVYDSAHLVLKTLAHHFQLGALTNGNADVRKTEIGHYFDYAWRAEEFGVSKPDPELFQRAFDEAGVEGREVIHVGDCHDNDVKGAAAAGALAIWFKAGGGVSDIATAVIGDLADLPEAVHQIVNKEADAQR